MTLAEQLAAEHAAHDPYDFKSKGENSPKSGHVNEPYQHQEYPLVVYSEKGSRTVNSKEELDQATADGFDRGAYKPVAAVPVATGAAIYAQTVFTDEDGNVIAESEKQKIKLVEIPVVAGSGTERWGADDWTGAGNGTTYPAVPSQAEADAAAAPDPAV